MILIKKYPRGSEWRKWDLHIHTPGTKKNDKFEGSTIEEKWDKYVQAINNSSVDIAVIGITDYFSIENYFIFCDKIANNKIIKSFDMVLPNVELRITPVTGSGKAINIHCLFNPIIADQIDSRFLGKLQFVYGDSTYDASKDSIARLGRKYSNNNALDEVSAYKKGIEQYVIGIEALRTIFKGDKELRENTIIVVANGKDGAGGLSSHKDFFDKPNESNKSSLDATVKSIYQFADAIFSSNNKDRDYFTGYGADNEAVITEQLNSLMPCYHGCDAHNNNKIFNPVENRYCWIKANPTFNGLKQTLYEPRERVTIQPNVPELKTGYHVIDKVLINHRYIQNEEIELNSGLNCIIGGRSTGKSVLLSAIAKKLKTETEAKHDNPKYNELIAKISDAITIVWKDGKENNEREIEFFNQGYMNQYSKDDKKFDDLVKSILKEKSNINLFDEYDSFVTNNKTKIQSAVNNLFGLQAKINNKNQQVNDIGDIEGIDKEILKLKGTIGSLKLESNFSDTEYKEFQGKKEQILNNNNAISKLKADQPQINRLLNENLIKSIEQSTISDTVKSEINALHQSLSSEFNQKWHLEISKIKERVQMGINNRLDAITVIENDDNYKKGLEILEKNQTLKGYEERLTKEDEKKKTITSLKDDILNLESESQAVRQEIQSIHKKYFAKAEEIANQLSTSFGNLEIKAYPRFLEKEYNNLLQSSINLLSNERKELANFNFENSGGNTGFEEEIEDKFERLFDDDIVLKNSYNNKDLLNRILGNFFRISYEVIYESDKYSEMSEGKQAFVVLKLLLDFSDRKCPILIDQPEDDLDNRAIYNDLVKYLKAKKIERQIIVVTHNPNIVVGTDSELVIVANQNGVNNKNTNGVKFQYFTGGIEDTSALNHDIDLVLEKQGIKEHVCEILEGGEYAFRLREKRYDIKK